MMFSSFEELSEWLVENTKEADHLDVCDTQGSIGYFDLTEIPREGVRSVDLFDGKGRKIFSVSISTNGVAYQVLQAGEDAGLFTTTDDEI